MRRVARAFLVAFLLVSAAVHAQVADRVNVRYFAGMPLPGRSIEALDFRIDRVRFSATADQEIDRFFSSLEATLSEHQIAGDWQFVIPDAPWIEITVVLNGRRTRLASAHVLLEKTEGRVVTERGVETLGERDRDAVLARQSETFRRHRLAFEKLLALTLEHVRARLAP